MFIRSKYTIAGLIALILAAIFAARIILTNKDTEVTTTVADTASGQGMQHSRGYETPSHQSHSKPTEKSIPGVQTPTVMSRQNAEQVTGFLDDLGQESGLDIPAEGPPTERVSEECVYVGMIVDPNNPLPGGKHDEHGVLMNPPEGYASLSFGTGSFSAQVIAPEEGASLYVVTNQVDGVSEVLSPGEAVRYREAMLVEQGKVEATQSGTPEWREAMQQWRKWLDENGRCSITSSIYRDGSVEIYLGIDPETQEYVALVRD